MCLALLFSLPARADVTVFAAASLRDVLEEALADIPDVRVAYGGSGALARQVAAGAPADVILLAHPVWMDWLVEQGAVAAPDAVDVARNSLVLIGPVGSAPMDAVSVPLLFDALQGGRLAMGQRDAVPAGQYAQQWLTRSGAWDALLPQLAETDNVRAALALVATGAAPLGIVYASDALAEPRVAVRWNIDGASHDPIRYVAAALTPEGRKVIDALTTPQAEAIFIRHGFSAP